MIEKTLSDPERISHNVLQCIESGVIVDFSLGQFTGVMSPVIFANKAALVRKLPSKMLTMYPNPLHEVEGQIARDEMIASRSHVEVPDYAPAKFALRVVSACRGARLTAGKPSFCSNCFGEAPVLRQCSVCHRVSYCGIPCQRLHWKTHKPHCVASPPTALKAGEVQGHS